MPDLYAQITTSIRASSTSSSPGGNPRRRPAAAGVRQRFLSWIDLPVWARVFEVGCGSGAICRELGWRRCARSSASTLGPVLAKARGLASFTNLAFREGDARALLRGGRIRPGGLPHCLCHVGRSSVHGSASKCSARRDAVVDGDFRLQRRCLGDHDPQPAPTAQ
jgi:hypothetical protein